MTIAGEILTGFKVGQLLNAFENLLLHYRTEDSIITEIFTTYACTQHSVRDNLYLTAEISIHPRANVAVSALIGALEVLDSKGCPLPPSCLHLAYVVAFSLQAILFSFHFHEFEPLDLQVSYDCAECVHRDQSANSPSYRFTSYCGLS